MSTSGVPAGQAREEKVATSEAVTATVEVAVDPATAFEIFTEEIGQWWRPGPINWNHADLAIGIRIEPGVGGRWLEVEDAETGEGCECGRITVWEPGERLVFLYRDSGHDLDDTEVEIVFQPVAGGTRVTLEHRGWERLQADLASRKRNAKRAGWLNILSWYSDWAFWGSPLRLKVRRGSAAP
ncbi:MAG: SRPBCC domain-containing protein [Gaiellaceae bacterium]